MPRNPDKTPCSVEGCRAWAIRGSDPPLCAPHRTRARSEGTVAACIDDPPHNLAQGPARPPVANQSVKVT